METMHIISFFSCHGAMRHIKFWELLFQISQKTAHEMFKRILTVNLREVEV